MSSERRLFKMSVFNVPVVIGVDEEAIAREIKENVEAQVVAKILDEIKKQMYKSSYYYGRSEYDDPEPLKNMIKTEIQKQLDGHQDLIIKEAAEILADKLARTKAVKEKAALIAEKVLEEEK